jgi:hypothetical protein
MSTQRYTPEFKEEAVRQIVDRGPFGRGCFVPTRCFEPQGNT